MQIIVVIALVLIVASLARVLFRKRVSTIPYSKDQFDKLYNDHGSFQYDDSGFTMSYKNLIKRVKWEDIDQLNVFKEDQITIDCITMEIVCNGNSLTINEEIPGWYQFVLKTKQIFPQVPRDWDIAIIQPAFQRNYRTIYRKTARI